MGLQKISTAAPAEGRDVIAGAGSAVVRIEPDGRHGLVLSDGPDAKAGQRLRLVDARTGRGPSLDAVLEGRPADGDAKAVPRTGPGDVVIFDAARAKGTDLLCGPAVARIHDGIKGPVQAMRMLARPTALSVTKLGAIQSIRLADPSLAVKVSTQAELSAFAGRMAGRDWPGGELGFILRNAMKPFARMTDEEARAAHEVGPDERESMEGFIRRLVVDNEILSAGPVEVIPTWRMPLTGAHMFREGINLKTPLPEPKAGSVTRQYLSTGTYPRLGYQPSFLILADDDEWGFGARTGRVVRSCLGFQPLRSGDPHTKSDMASAVRDTGRDGKKRPVVAGLSLFKGDEVAAAALARAGRRGDPPETALSQAKSTPNPAPAGGRPGARPGRSGHSGEDRDDAPQPAPQKIAGMFQRRGPVPEADASAPKPSSVVSGPRPRPAGPVAPRVAPRLPGMR